jgi:excisionase family DNA binding protein
MANAANGEPMLTPKQVAVLLGVSYETVRVWLRDGKLRSIKVGARYRIPESEVHAILGDEASTDRGAGSGSPLAGGVFGEDRPLIVPGRLERP